MHRTTNHKSSANRIFKSIASPFCGRERGFSSFLFVLALLALGSIIIVPLLNYMITGTKAGSTYERKTTELYSADAGVEYAIFWLQHGLLGGEGFQDTKDLTAVGSEYHDGPLPINDDSVDVTIENEKNESKVYRIVSTAIDNLTGSTTTVVSRVVPSIGFQGDFFGNAVTSVSDVTIKGDIWGDIQCGGTLNVFSGKNIYGNVACKALNNSGTIHGWAEYVTLLKYGTIIGGGSIVTSSDNIEEIWPSAGELDGYYYDNVSPYISSSVTSPGNLGPGMTGAFTPGVLPDADSIPPVNLTINTKTDAAPVKLMGTIVVTGDLVVNKPSWVDLNGQTLYVRGDINIWPDSVFSGSGVVIALGDVLFQPKMAGGGTGDSSIMLHYDGNVGANWATMTNPDTSLSDLNDVWGSVSTDVYAVGNTGTILKYYDPVGANPLAWYKEDITSVLPSSANLNGIWGLSSDNVFVVGDEATILHYYDPVGANPLGWYKQAGIGALLPSTTTNLRGIWGDPSGAIYAVGDQGSILHSPDGLTWEEITTGGLTFEDLWDVHGVVNGSDVELVVVGRQGTILHYRDSSWTKVPPPTVPTVMDLKGVWGFKDATSGDTTFYVVGAAAGLVTKTSTILRYFDEHSDGSGTWNKMSVGNNADMNDVWGVQSGGQMYVFSVGADGNILRRIDSGAWTKMNNSSTRSLNGVWGLSPSDVFAVGQPKSDFIFVMSVYGTSQLKPNGKFLGSVAGSAEVELFPGSSLRAPMGTGGMNYPKYRWMRLETYVIR